MKTQVKFDPKITRPDEPIVLIIGGNSMKRISIDDANRLIDQLTGAVNKATMPENKEVWFNEWSVQQTDDDNIWIVNNSEIGVNLLGYHSSKHRALMAIQCAIAVGITSDNYSTFDMNRFHALYKLAANGDLL